MLDFDRFEALTFDCYGTLIDWETGIVSTLGPILAHHGHEPAREALLERYARLEAEAEQGPFVSYKSILLRVLDGFGQELDFTPTDDERAAFAHAVRHWPPWLIVHLSSHAKVMWYLGSSRFAFEVVLVIRHRSSVFSLMTNDY